MTPFNLSFRQLIRKYIPQFTEKNVDDHEKLLTYRYVLRNELNFIPTKYLQEPREYKNLIIKRMEYVSEQAQFIIEPYKEQFEALRKLWIARRKFALEQGNFLQIPPTLKGLGRYISAIIQYQSVQIKTLPKLWKNRLKHFIKNLSFLQIVIIGGLTLLIILGGIAANSRFNEKPPEVSDIPDQTIKVGKQFFPIELDNYVYDPNHSDSEMKWSTNDSILNLKVNIDTNREATIRIPYEPPDLVWIGSDTIIFTATDPVGLADSDTAIFTVKAVYDSTKIQL